MLNALARPLAALLVTLVLPAVAFAAEGTAAHGGLGEQVSYLLVLPFIGMLLSIALMPMVAGHWWHHNRNQLLTAAAWGAPVLGWLLWKATDDVVGHDAIHALEHAAEEYVSFICLLGSLYIISGGILVKGDLEGKPAVNTAFLAIGAVLSNFIGTTGASMLLIRPMLRTNSEREYVRHVPLFFIFLVSNIGGALTPIGDPPLFLGYLRGVPFFWTLEHLFLIWLVPVGVLLLLFFAVDSWFYRKEDRAHRAKDRAHREPLSIQGWLNAALLGGVIAAVLLLSPEQGVHDFREYYAREIAMVVLAGVSWFTTAGAIKEGNSFTFGPILEVAALFVGIFITMVPATMLLQAQGSELGIHHAWQYFWATGALSAFLDNAPTYVTFAAMACGATEGCVSAEQLGTLAAIPAGAEALTAISAGAVFMGAMTYIGNGPNFMVKAIAEEQGYSMPSFFGYLAASLAILGPTFVLVTFLFFV